MKRKTRRKRSPQRVGAARGAAQAAPPRPLVANITVCALLILYAIVVLRTAWLSDDAYITFRTIDNFIGGYGLRWNAVKRVKAFTHPLSMFFL